MYIIVYISITKVSMSIPKCQYDTLKCKEHEVISEFYEITYPNLRSYFVIIKGLFYSTS